jgi:hypothetical protein
MHQNRPSHRLGSSILHPARPYVCHEVVMGVAGRGNVHAIFGSNQMPERSWRMQ